MQRLLLWCTVAVQTAQGLSAGYGLGDVIGAEYGDWSLNAGVTLYATEDGVYNNPEDTFLVYNVGVSMAF